MGVNLQPLAKSLIVSDSNGSIHRLITFTFDGSLSEMSIGSSTLFSASGMFLCKGTSVSRTT